MKTQTTLGETVDSNTEFIENKDDILKTDPDIKIGDATVKYSDISNMYPVNKQVPVKMLIYWDDLCQYTSLGLIDLINKIFGTNEKVDIEHFLTRNNQYINGMNYVYEVFKNVLTKDQINDIKHKFYWNLIEMSLKSSVYESVININTFFNKLTFYFPYKFKNCEKLEMGLRKIFNPSESHQTQFSFAYRTDIGFNDLLKQGNYNSVMTPSAGSTYKYILDNNLKKIDIFSSLDHNGMDDELISLFGKYNRLPKPNYCDLHLFYEQVVQ